MINNVGDKIKSSRASFLLGICGLLFSGSVFGQGRTFYQLKVYHLQSQVQLERVNDYLKTAYLPAMHRAGVGKVGVFRTLKTDTGEIKIYVIIPFQSLKDLQRLNDRLSWDKAYLSAGSDYINASYDQVPYQRIETIILQAFPGSPVLATPKLSAPKSERVYELRSYEGPTEKYHASKIKMFTLGGEIGLFKRLNFNGVFYSEVISGSHMPNLMYMTTFNNMEDRDQHWKAFGSDPEWKKLSATPEYQHNVSKADITFLCPTDYSDL
jgi:hypothetical protein